jgi:hypothetical protein
VSKPDTLKIRNWEKWQSYRRDRGQPPWIKVHREVMRNPEWVMLTDAQRGQLVGIWLLAADRDGVIPASPKLIQKLCYMDSEPDLQVFINLGFIEGDVNVTPERRQGDETETETEKEKASSEASSETIPVSAMWDLWIKRLGGDGRKPKCTQKRKAALRRLYLEHLKNEPDPLAMFDEVLHAVIRSDHHMSKREYQFPESLFRNEDRRDRWVQMAVSPSQNGGGDFAQQELERHQKAIADMQARRGA